VSQPLGKVTGDLDAARGPDVELLITVERAWFGGKVSVSLPRNLNCAACSGGGCDRCGRAGALSLWARGEPAREVQLVLPELPSLDQDVCLRVPGEGATEEGEGAALGPGHLLLRVRPGSSTDQGVVLCAPARMSDQARRQLAQRSLIMAVGLILLFLGMLRLSGWL